MRLQTKSYHRRFSSGVRKNRITHLTVPVSLLSFSLLSYFFFNLTRNAQKQHVDIRRVISPTSNPSFQCSICRLHRPCITSNRELLATAEELVYYRTLAQDGICEFHQESDGRLYLFGQLSSKKTYVMDRASTSHKRKEVYRPEDIFNLGTYSPHLPSFIWTVYVRALFFASVCDIGPSWFRSDSAVSCDVSAPTFLIPSNHQGLAWFKPLVQRIQKLVPSFAVLDDSAAQNHGSLTENVCFRSAILTDCLEERIPDKREYFLHGGESRNDIPRQGARRLRVLIISRRGTRELKNARVIAKAVSEFLFSEGVEHDDVSTLFEEIPFSEQQYLIRRSHVVIASHGAAVGQIVVSPRNALVIDVFPVGYYFSGFYSFAAWSNVTYVESRAEPDFETMSYCLKRRKGYYERWVNLTKTVGEEYNEKRRELCAIYGVRRCLRAQRLQANVTEIVATLAAWLPSFKAT